MPGICTLDGFCDSSMAFSSSSRPRFRSRLKSFLANIGEDLNVIVESAGKVEPPPGGFPEEGTPKPLPIRGAAETKRPEVPPTPEAAEAAPATVAPEQPPEIEESAEDLALAAAEEAASLRRAEDDAQLSEWQEALDAAREAREHRRARHDAMLADSRRYLESLLAAAYAKESEETDASELDGANGEEETFSPEHAAAAAPLPAPFGAEELEGYVPPILDDLRSMDLSQVATVREEEIEAQKNRLQDAIDSFAIDAFVYDAIVGPRVTQFRVKPGFGVRVETIAGLDRNLALAMKVRAVRVQAPIPGEPYVGIEVPNANALPLTLRAAFESRSWAQSEASIPLVLGMDITGKIVICDLAKAPHALIAGATGSGKSVCISNIILSLLYRFRPDELELVLVDPKKVEFALYKDLPHLIHPVVSEAKQACQALKWLVKEMEKRYDILSERKVRNIAGYNAKAEAEGFPKMPFMVLIVDELADLMMTAKEDVETPIARLAQMSRAVGIHTILATQRPSVNVITGVIKANFPTRIAFQVSSQIDSRTILDGKGAESLQGRGDMLYTPPGVGQLQRLQAPFVDDDEILAVTDRLRAQLEPRYRAQLASLDDVTGPGDDLELEYGEDGADPLLKQAVEIIATTGKASTSFLQRKLRIGYNRAARLTEELEDRGYIGPQIGTNPREILVEPGEFTL
jgi:S-DNA-T family DNA segregation ATPase FtsK/SpoIIIE